MPAPPTKSLENRMTTEILAKTPLHALHLELGARMVPFAGYEMPVQYPLGVMKEHQHTRTQAGLFDEEVDASRRTRMETAQDRMLEFTQSWNGRVKHLVTDGPPNENIDEAVRRRSADLVVVGSRGASATRMVLLGSVPEALVGHGPCDVYIARFPSTFRRP